MAESFVSGTDRQNQIVHLLEQHQRISVAELCAFFSISEATARRDLEALALQGKIQRVHGGALLLPKAPPELPVLERSHEQEQEKQRIGRVAAGLVNNGDTVFLGSGTTVLEAGRKLRERKHLTVITNSLPVLNLMNGNPEITVVSLGGMLRASELSFIGHIAEQALADVRADKVIIGIRAVSIEHGLTSDYLPEAMTDRAIIRVGREVIVVADNSKFGRVSTALLAPVENVHTIVTDSGTPAEVIHELERRGVSVIIA
jgi:DeoR family transcriptional regulator of aga operon